MENPFHIALRTLHIVKQETIIFRCFEFCQRRNNLYIKLYIAAAAGRGEDGAEGTHGHRADLVQWGGQVMQELTKAQCKGRRSIPAP